MRLTKRDEAIFLLDGFSAGREVRRSRTRVSQNAFYAEEVELVVKRFNTEPHEVLSLSLSRLTWQSRRKMPLLAHSNFWP